MTTPYPEKHARFVETMGLITETEGMARIMGRIFGYLLLADTPQSLDDMAAALGVSKASISTDARRLETLGLLSRVGQPGDRRDYYELAPDFIARAMRGHMERMAKLRTALAEALDGLDTSDRVRQRLHEFAAVYYNGMCQLEETIAALERGDMPTPPSRPR